jgi:hypothetical protein
LRLIEDPVQLQAASVSGLFGQVVEHTTGGCLRIIDTGVQSDFDIVTSNVRSLFDQASEICSEVLN